MFGEDGIINRAILAKEETEQASLQEQIGLYISDISMEMLTNPDYPDNGVIQLEDLPLEFQGEQPKLGWVNVENNIVTEYEFYFDNEYILKTENEFRVKEYSNLINVKDFGAVGDGTTDDTEAIKSAVASLNENGGILYFPTGTYVVSVSDNKESSINLNSDKNIEVDFGKSTIQMTTNGYPNYYIVNAENCTNVEVRNGNLIGDRLTHDYVTTESSHCWGHGVVSKNNKSCNILNMEISDMTGDAISTSTYDNGTTKGTTNINDCNLHHCRRMGITIIDSDIVNVKNTNIQYIGTTDGIEGVAPKSGIDIEPHYENGTINYVLLDNVNIENIADSATFGIIQNGPHRENVEKIDIVNSKIENFFIGNSANIKKSELINPNTIRQCTIEDSYLYNEEGYLYLTDTIVKNCTFEGNDIKNEKNDANFRIIPTNVTVNNSTFKNLMGTGNYETNSLAEFGLTLANDYNFTEESGNNIYDNCAIVMDFFTDKNSEIKNSYIFVRSYAQDINFNTINIENCEIKFQNKITNMNNCNAKNCIFRKSPATNPQIYFNNSTMTCDSITSQDYFAGIAMFFDASTINVLGEVNKSAFSNVTFSNASKIILDRYSSVNLDIPKSNLGTDYTIECKGTEVIE